METNKYYTPTIEEFHIGFEYEEDVFIEPSGDWRKFKFPYYYTPQHFHHLESKDAVNAISLLLEDNRIRVKLLDREDIISLDWELDSIVEKECFYIHKTSSLQNDIRLVFREKESSIEINSSKFGECFYGIIKNKSELRKLMNQLNIK